jgi:hypothetical protein
MAEKSASAFACVRWNRPQIHTVYLSKPAAPSAAAPNLDTVPDAGTFTGAQVKALLAGILGHFKAQAVALPDHGGTHDTLVLFPGFNRIPLEQLNGARANKVFMHYAKPGTAMSHEGKKERGPALEILHDLDRLASLSVDEAKQTVADTISRDLLLQWAQYEARGPVRAAIDARLPFALPYKALAVEEDGVGIQTSAVSSAADDAIADFADDT